MMWLRQVIRIGVIVMFEMENHEYSVGFGVRTVGCTSGISWISPVVCLFMSFRAHQDLRKSFPHSLADTLNPNPYSAAVMIGKRSSAASMPHNLTHTALGTALFW
jgi:hypothetical protein